MEITWLVIAQISDPGINFFIDVLKMILLPKKTPHAKTSL